MTEEYARNLAIRVHTDTCRCKGDIDNCRAYRAGKRAQARRAMRNTNKQDARAATRAS